MPACRYFCGEVVEDGGGLEAEAFNALRRFAAFLSASFSASFSSWSEYSGMSLLKSAGNAGPFNFERSMVKSKFGVGLG
ncbi:MAG: hypothetical protein DVB22_001426 [Verrucomicrobia bacterium]|nr:MAG: hypothetical protein DVB22_001426 [Verrucomicrobiota bacterium]